jgi:predicted RNA-binding protein with PUA-like domain
MQYWLFKTEPDAFSIDDLANMPNLSVRRYYHTWRNI